MENIARLSLSFTYQMMSCSVTLRRSFVTVKSHMATAEEMSISEDRMLVSPYFLISVNSIYFTVLLKLVFFSGICASTSIDKALGFRFEKWTNSFPDFQLVWTQSLFYFNLFSVYFFNFLIFLLQGMLWLS